LYKKEQLLRFSGGIIAAWWDVVDQGSIWGGRTGFIEMLETETDILRTSEDLPRFSKRLIQVKDFNS
jgi:hypothetical protein